MEAEYVCVMKSEKEFVFALKRGTLDDVHKQLEKSKFIKFGDNLINTSEIEHIKPK